MVLENEDVRSRCLGQDSFDTEATSSLIYMFCFLKRAAGRKREEIQSDKEGVKKSQMLNLGSAFSMNDLGFSEDCISLGKLRG